MRMAGDHHVGFHTRKKLFKQLLASFRGQVIVVERISRGCVKDRTLKAARLPSQAGWQLIEPFNVRFLQLPTGPVAHGSRQSFLGRADLGTHAVGNRMVMVPPDSNNLMLSQPADSLLRSRPIIDRVPGEGHVVECASIALNGL